MRGWRFEFRAFEEVAGAIVEEPILAGFKGDDNRMTSRRMMFRGVLIRRGIAAANVTTLGAAAEMQPPITVRQALNAAGSACRGAERDSASLSFHVPVPFVGLRRSKRSLET